jgi:hypothetical protein
VSVLLGNGNGTFHSAANFGVGSNPQSVAVGDVNGDGRPDLVTANFGSNNASVLLDSRKTATHLQITAPASVAAGTPFTITVRALAAGNGVDDLYTGTVTFTSSDGGAVLPGNYTLTKRDLGVHTFTITLNSTSPPARTITVTDTVKGTITGTASITVNSAGPVPPTAGGSADRAPAGAAGDAGAVGAATAARVATDNRVALQATPEALARTRPIQANPFDAGMAAEGFRAGLLVRGVLSGPGRLNLAPVIRSLSGYRGEENPPARGLRPMEVEALFAADPLWLYSARPRRRHR